MILVVINLNLQINWGDTFNMFNMLSLLIHEQCMPVFLLKSS
jgi:hypothetical protein